VVLKTVAKREFELATVDGGPQETMSLGTQSEQLTDPNYASSYAADLIWLEPSGGKPSCSTVGVAGPSTFDEGQPAHRAPLKSKAALRFRPLSGVRGPWSNTRPRRTEANAVRRP
jgi:hypothetical protein